MRGDDKPPSRADDGAGSEVIPVEVPPEIIQDDEEEGDDEDGCDLEGGEEEQSNSQDGFAYCDSDPDEWPTLPDGMLKQIEDFAMLVAAWGLHGDFGTLWQTDDFVCDCTKCLSIFSDCPQLEWDEPDTREEFIKFWKTLKNAFKFFKVKYAEFKNPARELDLEVDKLWAEQGNPSIQPEEEGEPELCDDADEAKIPEDGGGGQRKVGKGRRASSKSKAKAFGKKGCCKGEGKGDKKKVARKRPAAAVLKKPATKKPAAATKPSSLSSSSSSSEPSEPMMSGSDNEGDDKPLVSAKQSPKAKSKK